MKEIKTFFRDQTQWSQIFLIVALIIIYLYNFSVLPLFLVMAVPGRQRRLMHLLGAAGNE